MIFMKEKNVIKRLNMKSSKIMKKRKLKNVHYGPVAQVCLNK